MAFKTLQYLLKIVQVSDEKNLNWGTCSKYGKEDKKNCLNVKSKWFYDYENVKKQQKGKVNQVMIFNRKNERT